MSLLMHPVYIQAYIYYPLCICWLFTASLQYTQKSDTVIDHLNEGRSSQKLRNERLSLSRSLSLSLSSPLKSV